MWLMTPGFCPCTITILLMTTAVSVLFIMFWEILVSSKLLIAYRSCVQSNSCFLSSLSSACFSQSSKLSLIFYSRVPNFFCSGAFLTVTVFLCAISSVIRGICWWGTPPSTSAFLDLSIIDGIRFPSLRVGNFCPLRIVWGFMCNDGHFCVLPRQTPGNLQGHRAIHICITHGSNLILGVHGLRVLRPLESHTSAQFFCCLLVGYRRHIPTAITLALYIPHWQDTFRLAMERGTKMWQR